MDTPSSPTTACNKTSKCLFRDSGNDLSVFEDWLKYTQANLRGPAAMMPSLHVCHVEDYASDKSGDNDLAEMDSEIGAKSAHGLHGKDTDENIVEEGVGNWTELQPSPEPDGAASGIGAWKSAGSEREDVYGKENQGAGTKWCYQESVPEASDETPYQPAQTRESQPDLNMLAKPSRWLSMLCAVIEKLGTLWGALRLWRIANAGNKGLTNEGRKNE